MIDATQMEDEKVIIANRFLAQLAELLIQACQMLPACPSRCMSGC